MNAISFLLLSSGMAICGWRFLEAQRENISGNNIGKIISSLFFLSAGYNGILGIGSLFLSQSPNGLFIIQLFAHLALAALAFMSVYALYYIFWPTVSPRLPMTTIGLIGGLGFLLLIASSSQLLASAITFCLLTVSLLATLYIFIQLFKRTDERSIKILSITFSILTLASVAHALIQLIASTQRITSLPFTAVEITLGLVGAGVLLWSISTPAMRSAVAIFIILLGWWATLYFGLHWKVERIGTSLWTDVYSIIIVLGIWFGFRATLRAGGFKTSIGKAIYLFTLGLFLQITAGIIYGFYVNWLSIDLPYPSLADIGWFSSIFLYILGAYRLGKYAAAGQQITITDKILVLLTWITSFTFFWMIVNTGGFTFDWHKPLITCLDIAYSLIGSSYLAFGMLAYRAAKGRNIIIFQKPILWIIAALAIQHISDTNFVYHVSKGNWTDGSYGDLLLLSAYFAMTMAIIKLGAAKNITHKKTITLGMNYIQIQALPHFSSEMKNITDIYPGVINIFETVRDHKFKKPYFLKLKTEP